MKIQFKATGSAPKYTIKNETINGIELSELEHGDKFIGNDETKEAGIRYAYRDEDGTLHVTLKQSVIASQLKGRKAHWREGNEIDVTDYDPNKCYVVPTGVSDLTEGKDYEIVWAKGLGKGEEGWTIREVSNG